MENIAWYVIGFCVCVGFVSAAIVFVVRQLAEITGKAQSDGAVISAQVVKATMESMFGDGTPAEQIDGGPASEVTGEVDEAEPPFFPDVEFDPTLPGALESIAEGGARWAETQQNPAS